MRAAWLEFTDWTGNLNEAGFALICLVGALPVMIGLGLFFVVTHYIAQFITYLMS